MCNLAIGSPSKHKVNVFERHHRLQEGHYSLKHRLDGFWATFGFVVTRMHNTIHIEEDVIDLYAGFPPAAGRFAGAGGASARRILRSIALVVEF